MKMLLDMKQLVLGGSGCRVEAQQPSCMQSRGAHESRQSCGCDRHESVGSSGQEVHHRWRRRLPATEAFGRIHLVRDRTYSSNSTRAHSVEIALGQRPPSVFGTHDGRLGILQDALDLVGWLSEISGRVLWPTLVHFVSTPACIQRAVVSGSAFSLARSYCSRAMEITNA